MKLELSMQVKQSQKLNLTQELRQSIELLQMNTYELEVYITEELKENPVLEAEYSQEIDWLKFMDKIKDRVVSKNYSYDSDTPEINPENFIAGYPNLQDHLEEELSTIELSPKERPIAEYILQRINSDGYFLVEISKAAVATKTSEEEFLRILKKVQTIEPRGMAATSLSECLLLQLEEDEPGFEVLSKIIEEDLNLVANKKYGELQKKHNITEKELSKILDRIKNLDPKPGKRFSDFEPVYILPDIIVEKTESGLEIIDNSTLPMLHISAYYQQLLKDTEEEEVKEYIKDKLNKSLNLIRNIDQRKMTIRTVADHILQYQMDFFVNAGELRPMRLKDIASTTGYHESTISRTINGKYMLTPKGVFEFKHFFETGIASDSGEEVSVSNIKNEIQKMIDQENKKKPLSDQKICNELTKQGIQISRRTVAKYRDEMQILGSALRKEI